MTLDEKLGMVNGWPNGVSAPPQTDRLIGVGFIPGVPRLGVPALTFTDGPAGVRMNLPTTAMPAPVALAATFSADLAERYGEVLGRDGRSRTSHGHYSPANEADHGEDCGCAEHPQRVLEQPVLLPRGARVPVDLLRIVIDEVPIGDGLGEALGDPSRRDLAQPPEVHEIARG